MAHANIFERRDAVKQLLIDTKYSTKNFKHLTLKFDCSISAIRSDIIALSVPEGKRLWPSKKLKNAILERDAYTCQYCGTTKGAIVVDHVVASTLGGASEVYNLVAACNSCNIKKAESPWIPNNIHILSQLNKEWANFIIQNHQNT